MSRLFNGLSVLFLLFLKNLINAYIEMFLKIFPLKFFFFLPTNMTFILKLLADTTTGSQDILPVSSAFSMNRPVDRPGRFSDESVQTFFPY
jgi:hypothetical protein